MFVVVQPVFKMVIVKIVKKSPAVFYIWIVPRTQIRSIFMQTRHYVHNLLFTFMKLTSFV